MWSLGALSLEIRRTLERLARGLKALGMLTFLTVFFSPMPWFFVILAETKRGLVLFRGLYLLELKVENFSGLSFE